MSLFTRRSSIMVVLVIACIAGFAAPSRAEIEWTDKRNLTLESAPLDIIATPDGKWCVVLSRGQLTVYTVPDNVVVARFPVDPAFDRMRFSEAEEQIILLSSTGTTVKFIQLDEVFTFSLNSRPFRGPENAAVTVVVFSDYQ